MSAPAGAEAAGEAGLRRSAVRGVASVVGSRLMVQVLTVVVTFEVARLLLPYDYGVVTTSAVFLNLGDALASAGLAVALVQKPELTERDMAEGFTLNLLLSLAICATLFAAAAPLAVYFELPDLKAALCISALTLLLSPFRTMSMALLDRRMQFGRQSAVFTASALAQSAVSLSAAYAGFGYWSLIASYCVARVLDTAAFSYLARWRPRLCLPGASGWGLIKFVLHVTGSTLAWQVFSQSDFAVAAKVVGPVELGYYALSFQLITLPANRLSSTFGQVAYTVFCRLQDRRDQVRAWYLRLVALAGAVGLPVFVGIALVAGDGVAVVLGPKWLPAAPILRLLCVPGYVLFLTCTLTPVLNAFGRPDLPAKYNAAYALFMPAAFLLAGRSYGLAGICAAWAVLYPAITAVLVYLTRPVLGFGVVALARSQVPACAASAAMAIAVLGIQWCLPGAGRAPLRLTLSVATGAAVYPAAVWMLARRTVVRDLRMMLQQLRDKS